MRVKVYILFHCIGVEMCMGMGKTGIPWVSWESYGTHGNTINHGNGDWMGMEIKRMEMGINSVVGMGKNHCIL